MWSPGLATLRVTAPGLPLFSWRYGEWVMVHIKKGKFSKIVKIRSFCVHVTECYGFCICLIYHQFIIIHMHGGPSYPKKPFECLEIISKIMVYELVDWDDATELLRLCHAFAFSSFMTRQRTLLHLQVHPPHSKILRLAKSVLTVLVQSPDLQFIRSSPSSRLVLCRLAVGQC